MHEYIVFFFFKQKTAYEIVSRDWSSDVCSSDLRESATTAAIDSGLMIRGLVAVQTSPNACMVKASIDRKSVV